MARSRWFLVVALGCAHPAKPAAPATPATGDSVAPAVITPPCATYEFYALSLTSFPSETGTHDAFYAADSAARAHYERGASAGEAHHYGEAAAEFLACGEAYRAVPDGDLGVATAIKNAQLCYKNSIFAYANAGLLQRRGQQQLELAASDDRRAGDYIRAELAKAPVECPASPDL